LWVEMTKRIFFFGKSEILGKVKKIICRSASADPYLWVEMTKRNFFGKSEILGKVKKTICRSASADAYLRLKKPWKIMNCRNQN
jgi:hypothetical protein